MLSLSLGSKIKPTGCFCGVQPPSSPWRTVRQQHSYVDTHQNSTVEDKSGLINSRSAKPSVFDLLTSPFTSLKWQMDKCAQRGDFLMHGNVKSLGICMLSLYQEAAAAKRYTSLLCLNAAALLNTYFVFVSVVWLNFRIRWVFGSLECIFNNVWQFKHIFWPHEGSKKSLTYIYSNFLWKCNQMWRLQILFDKFYNLKIFL